MSYAYDFVRTVEKTWYDAPFEAKIKLQKLIFPKGIEYADGKFSNTKLCRAFEIINTLAASYSIDVTQRYFISNHREKQDPLNSNENKNQTPLISNDQVMQYLTAIKEVQEITNGFVHSPETIF